VKRSANRTEKIWIGTSGWTYDGWRGPFYPKETPKRLWLSYYSTQFTTTEINGSFYRTPTLDAVRHWRDSTPREFTFAWKASKFITHWKRLSVKCENSIALMETRLEALGPKGCLVLFQLPPNFSADQARLAAFIQMLPNTRRYAFEFRHGSWYHDGIMELLQSCNAALCISDHGGRVERAGLAFAHTVWVDYRRRGAQRILDDDILRIWGRYTGIRSYTTVLGATMQIPSVHAAIVELSRDGEARVN
jgi:uncharacterized protein YecE (DUF72 family)